LVRVKKGDGSAVANSAIAEKLESLVLEETQALPGCAGFRIEYVRKEAQVSIKECGSQGANLPPRVIKLSESQQQLLEKSIQALKYIPASGVINAMACIPAAGAKISKVVLKNSDGNELVLKVGANTCLDGSAGVVEEKIFEQVRFATNAMFPPPVMTK
jgi:hypothetical protein